MHGFLLGNRFLCQREGTMAFLRSVQSLHGKSALIQNLLLQVPHFPCLFFYMLSFRYEHHGIFKVPVPFSFFPLINVD
jgi:hypothetical protein